MGGEREEREALQMTRAEEREAPTVGRDEREEREALQMTIAERPMSGEREGEKGEGERATTDMCMM